MLEMVKNIPVLFMGAGAEACKKKNRSRSRTDRLRNTADRFQDETVSHNFLVPVWRGGSFRGQMYRYRYTTTLNYFEKRITSICKLKFKNCWYRELNFKMSVVTKKYIDYILIVNKSFLFKDIALFYLQHLRRRQWSVCKLLLSKPALLLHPQWVLLPARTDLPKPRGVLQSHQT